MMEDYPENSEEIQHETGWEAELARLDIIDPSRVQIALDSFRRLHVLVDGETEYLDLKPVPVFPISGVAPFISFLDLQGKEVVLLHDASGLDPESRRVLKEELNRTYFVPKITHIYNIEDRHGTTRWEVETDRGYRIFDVRDKEDVRIIGRKRLLLQDADGNRFEVEDMFAMDEHSQKVLDKEV